MNASQEYCASGNGFQHQRVPAKGNQPETPVRSTARQTMASSIRGSQRRATSLKRQSENCASGDSLQHQRVSAKGDQP